MAFSARNAGFLPTSGGTGLLLYSHDTDTVATIIGNAYWSAAPSTLTVEDRQVRGAMEDYIAEKQSKSGVNGGVPIIITGNDAKPPADNYKATLSNTGRIQIVDSS